MDPRVVKRPVSMTRILPFPFNMVEPDNAMQKGEKGGKFFKQHAPIGSGAVKRNLVLPITFKTLLCFITA